MKLFYRLVKPVILLGLLSLFANNVSIAAGINIGGSGSLGFECDPETKLCTCIGPQDSLDCRAMKKNCTIEFKSFKCFTDDWKPDMENGKNCECVMPRISDNLSTLGLLPGTQLVAPVNQTSTTSTGLSPSTQLVVPVKQSAATKSKPLANTQLTKPATKSATVNTIVVPRTQLVTPLSKKSKATSSSGLKQKALLGNVVQSTALSSAISIDSITLTQPNSSSCTYKWTAKLRNTGSSPMENMTVQAYQGNLNGMWAAASGSSIPSLLAGGTRSTNPITFVRKAGKSRLKVQIFKSSRVIVEKTVNLPAEQVNIGLNSYSASATTYQVRVQNLSTRGLSDVIVQAYSAGSSTGPWQPAGGISVACIAGNNSYLRKGNKPGSNSYVKIQLKQDSKVIKEKVFSTNRKLIQKLLPGVSATQGVAN